MRTEDEIRKAVGDLRELKEKHLARATDANDEGLAALHNELAVEADTKIESLEWALGEIDTL